MAVQAVTEIRKVAVIPPDDAVQRVQETDADLPKRSIERINMVMGRKATKDIARMQFLRTEDI
jgi:hypothetical protein